jgi:hypothetical protein
MMDTTLLKQSPSYQAASHACKRAFDDDIVAFKYGAEEALTAWLWHATGWDAAMLHLSDLAAAEIGT